VREGIEWVFHARQAARWLPPQPQRVPSRLPRLFLPLLFLPLPCQRLLFLPLL
jgi:hypothetical protein